MSYSKYKRRRGVSPDYLEDMPSVQQRECLSSEAGVEIEESGSTENGSWNAVIYKDGEEVACFDCEEECYYYLAKEVEIIPL